MNRALRVRAAARDHTRITALASGLGQNLARLIEPAIARLAAEGEPDQRCRSCAFRPGTVPNGCAQTMMDAVKSVVEHIPFYCHMHVDAAGHPTKVCHGWFASAHTGRHPEPGQVPWPFSPSDELVDQLMLMGYTDIVQTLQGPLCGLFRFNYTTGLVVGLDADSYTRRYCFEHEEDARNALQLWDGEGHPGGPWIKCKGTYEGRQVDLLNPELRA